MELTDPVKRILDNYESDNPGTKAIRDDGGNGSIIGRNTSQRPKQDAWTCWATSSRSTRAETEPWRSARRERRRGST